MWGGIKVCVCGHKGVAPNERGVYNCPKCHYHWKIPPRLCPKCKIPLCECYEEFSKSHPKDKEKK